MDKKMSQRSKQDAAANIIGNSLLARFYSNAKPEYEPQMTIMQRMDLEKEDYVRRAFLDPVNAAKQVPLFSDKISAGDVLKCKATTLYGQNEVYLVAAQDFPGNLNMFIYNMSLAYKKFLTQPRRYQLLVKFRNIKPGILVVVFHAEEFVRAQVIGKVVKENFSLKVRLPKFKVLLVDLGEYQDVRPNDMFLLHQDFATQPAYAIRACLPGVEKYKKEQGCLDKDIDQKVCNNLLTTVFEKEIEVKFIRKKLAENAFMPENVWEWEMTFLRVVDEERYRFQHPQSEVSVEQRMTKKAIGREPDSSAEEELEMGDARQRLNRRARVLRKFITR